MAKRGLGKGIGALFGTEANETDIIERDISFINNISSENVTELKISQIEPNKEQPRKAFDEEKLGLLADSIKKHGVIQPIIVKDLNNGFYQIVAGERRWRASRIAGLSKIPAIIRSYDELTTMQVALIENLQRENLNPIEEALSYKALLDDFSLTQEQVSEQVGKSRSAIANSIRLLSLPQKVREMLEKGTLSSGHARAILSVNDDEAKLLLAEKIVENALSVRQAEQLAKSLNNPKKGNKKSETITQLDLQLGEIQKRMSDILGTKVKILNGAKKGKIEIEYYSANDLERLLRMLDI
ncbi:MAG: ParB/RepB/Spo0J family partition protein [Ruminococcaceae bacterium]|nr:ParB/RepB/Spo0J family partition protein [Oscillospiraceae bacterium]